MTSPTDRFAYHRSQPEISIDVYARRRCIELGAWVAARRRTYLDKCFWIQLREARVGSAPAEGAVTLLRALECGVSEGRLICPISDVLFLELMKQSDPQTRAKTAQLIDELSCGVTLAPQPTRVATEVAHLMHGGSGRALHPLEHMMWTKVPYVLGMQHPIAEAFPPAEQLVIQKAFFDHLWDVPLSSMLSTLGSGELPAPTYPALAERLNRENAAHASQMRSFAQVYRDEVNGVLELAAVTGHDVIHEMTVQAAGQRFEVTSNERMAVTREVLSVLQTVVRKPVGRRALRTLHIGALLHAALRWNRLQKIDANDLYDFHHAEAALAYCDDFLTDGPMHALLTQGHLGLSRDFKCRVESSIVAAAQMFGG